MADQYAPTTDEVRDTWAFGTTRGADMREGLAEFDRWLAAYEAEVRERIAQDIEAHEAERRRLGMSAPKRGRVDPISFAYEHAARIARGATRGDAWKVDLIDWTRCTCHDADDPTCPEHKEDA